MVIRIELVKAQEVNRSALDAPQKKDPIIVCNPIVDQSASLAEKGGGGQSQNYL